MDIWNDFREKPNESELKNIVLAIQKFLKSKRKDKQWWHYGESFSVNFNQQN
jgi:hypothetical protein